MRPGIGYWPGARSTAGEVQTTAMTWTIVGGCRPELRRYVTATREVARLAVAVAPRRWSAAGAGRSTATPWTP